MSDPRPLLTIPRPGQRARIALVVGLLVAIFAILAACSAPSTSANVEGKQQEDVSSYYVTAQPIPGGNQPSGMRQSLIEIETAQIQAKATTSIVTPHGAIDPIMVCPSMGTPIAASASLSNPQQIAYRSNASNYGYGVLSQMDPNGIYTPPSTAGTYVMCVAPDGQPYAVYTEADVTTVFGPAAWDPATHQLKLVGQPSVKFTKGK